MQACIQKENGVLNVAFTGRLDTVTSAELRDELDNVGFENVDVYFDFTNVEYISSAGLRLLIALQKQATETGNKLVLRNVNKIVAEVLRVSGLNKSFTIV